jgi:hypothetical protein
MKKLHDFSGFHAYWIYVTVKSIHFGSKKFDIMRQRLPKKERFLKSWNDGRKDRDGMMFYRVMERLPANKAAYIRCFAAYYMRNSSFHVSDIMNDDFDTYKANELELNDILNKVKSDYLTATLYCHEKDIQPEDMFYGRAETYKRLPLIYRLYDIGKISHNSLIAFNEIFGMGNFQTRGFHDMNIVDAEKIKSYRLIFDKYSPIVYHHFEGIEWQKEIQEYHHHIMKYGR